MEAGERARGTIFTEQVLVVSQKSKLIEVNNQYTIYDGDGLELASVRQVGQNLAKKALRFLGTPVDKHLRFQLQVTDPEGNVVLQVHRPAKLLKSRVVVQDAEGADLGQIVQQNAVGRIRFSLEHNGNQVGTISGESWTSWDFVVETAAGEKVASISRSLEGLSLLEDMSGLLHDRASSADSYAVRIDGPLDEPLRTLVVAAALGLDTALHQD